MNAPQEWNVQAVQRAGHRFVGLDHEHFNQRMREALVFRLGAGDLALVVQHQFHLGQPQHNLPRLQPALLDALGQRVHLMQQFHHCRRVTIDLARTIGMRDNIRVVDDRLRLPIPQAACAANHRIGKAAAHRPRIFIEGDERAFAQPRHALLQTAHAVAQNLRQHGDGMPGEIATVAALLGLGVQRAAGLNEK